MGEEKVIIIVRGGVVQVVRSSNPDIQIEIIDYDDLSCEKIDLDTIDEHQSLKQIY